MLGTRHYIEFFTKTQDLTLIFLSKFFELQSPVTLGFHSLVSRNRTRTDATINNLIPFDLKPCMLITHKYSEFFKAQFNLQSCSTLQHTLQILLQHKATHVLLKAQKDLGFKRQKLRTFDSVRQQPDSEPNTQVFLGSQDMR